MFVAFFGSFPLICWALRSVVYGSLSVFTEAATFVSRVGDIWILNRIEQPIASLHAVVKDGR